MLNPWICIHYFPFKNTSKEHWDVERKRGVIGRHEYVFVSEMEFKIHFKDLVERNSFTVSVFHLICLSVGQHSIFQEKLFLGRSKAICNSYFILGNFLWALTSSYMWKRNYVGLSSVIWGSLLKIYETEEKSKSVISL